jgi:hypothetical protein
MGYDDTEYRPAKPKKALPKTPKAQAAQLRKANQARINYENRVAQVGTTKQHQARMKAYDLFRAGQLDMRGLFGGSMEKLTKNLKK